MKCIAIDDEPVALSILSNYCKRMDGLELITFSNPVTAMLEVNRIKPDLIFLDIKIGEINGIDLARETPASTSLVFTTA